MMTGKDVRKVAGVFQAAVAELGVVADLLDEKASLVSAVEALRVDHATVTRQLAGRRESLETALSRIEADHAKGKAHAEETLADLGRQREALQARLEELRGQITEAAARAQATRVKEEEEHASRLAQMTRAREAAASELRELQVRVKAFHDDLRRVGAEAP
jgi:chromosome segregation ATPase